MRDATGTQLPELVQGFSRFVTSNRDSEKSLKDLALAEDISIARHIDLASAAQILARAEAGSLNAIRRLGVVIPAVTTHQAALRREHERAVEAGVRFSAASNALYRTSLQQAKALDAEATKTKVLAEAQERFGGQTARFVQTARGEYARLRIAIQGVITDVGASLLPGLASAAEGFREEADAIRHSEGFHRGLKAGVHDLGEAYHFVAGAVRAVAPSILAVAHAAQTTLGFLGVGPVLAFAAGFKVVTSAVNIAGLATARYRAILAAGRGEKATEAATAKAAAAATQAQTAALALNSEALAVNTEATIIRLRAVGTAAEGEAANTLAADGLAAALAREDGALAANTTSLGRNVVALDALAAANARLVTANSAGVLSEVERNGVVAGRSLGNLGGQTAKTEAGLARVTTGLKGFGRGLFALAGGPTTVAALGVGALAFGIYKLATADTAAEKANNRLRDSLNGLSGALGDVEALARDYAQTTSSIRADKIAFDTAKANLALAENALKFSNAGKASTEYAQLLQAVRQAQNDVRESGASLGRDQKHLQDIQARQAVAEVTLHDRRADAIKRTNELALLAAKQAIRDAGIRGEQVRSVAEAIEVAKKYGAVTVFTADASKRLSQALIENVGAISKGEAPLHAQIIALGEFIAATKSMPSDKTLRIVLQAKNPTDAIKALTLAYERLNPPVDTFARTLTTEATAIQTTNPRIAARLVLLARFEQAVGRIPSKKETELVLTTPNLRDALNGILAAIVEARREGGVGGLQTARAFAANFKQALKGSDIPAVVRALFASILKEGAAAGGAAATSVKDDLAAAISVAQSAVRDTEKTIAGLSAKVNDAAATTREAGLNVADAQRSLADAIREGNQSVRDAIIGAEQNLFSIGESLSSTIGQFLDAVSGSEEADLASTPAGKQLAALRKELAKEGGPTPELERRSRELAAQLQAQAEIEGQDSEKRKERIRRNIADLVDQFNKGSITISEFNRRLAGLLAKEGITYKKAGKTLGIAFADGFRAELKAIQEQAAAIAAGPRIKGLTGLEPNIVRPIDALRASQQRIADAQRSRDDAQRALLKDQRALETAQSKYQAALVTQGKNHTHLQELIEKNTRHQAEKSAAQLDATRNNTVAIRNLNDTLSGKGGGRATASSPGRPGQRGAAAGGASVGASLGLGVKGGIEDSISAVINAVELLVDAALRAARRRAKAKSPSEETRALGIDIGDGLVLGLEHSGDRAARAAEHLAERTIQKLRRAQHERSGLMDDLLHGIRDVGGIGHHELPGDFRQRPVALDRSLPRREAREESRHRELVGAVRGVARTEEQTGHALLSEERRQTEQLRLIRLAQTRRHFPTSKEPRPGGTAASDAKASAKRGLST